METAAPQLLLVPAVPAAFFIARALAGGSQVSLLIVAWVLAVPPTARCVLPAEIMACVFAPLFIYFTWYVPLVSALLFAAGAYIRIRARDGRGYRESAAVLLALVASALWTAALARASAPWFVLARIMSHFLLEPLAGIWVRPIAADALFFFPWVATAASHPTTGLVFFALATPSPEASAPWTSVAGLLAASLLTTLRGGRDRVFDAAVRCALSLASAAFGSPATTRRPKPAASGRATLSACLHGASLVCAQTIYLLCVQP